MNPTSTLRRHPPSNTNDKKSKCNSALQNNQQRTLGPWDDEDRVSDLKTCLTNWSNVEVCPSEDPDIHWSSAELSQCSALSQRYHSTSSGSSSDEDENESISYQTESCNNALPSPGRSKCFSEPHLEGMEERSSDLWDQKECKVSVKEASEIISSEENKSKKRKKLSKHVDCKRSRKDHCRRFLRPRTVFHKALDALKMSWEDPLLIKILRFGEMPSKFISLIRSNFTVQCY